MAQRQYDVTDARRHRLRHIMPSATGAVTVLNTKMGFEELPVSHLPTSQDFSDASWTARLGDAGEFSVTFPNREASDGEPWRSRFNPYGPTEFIEIYRDDVLEAVHCILTNPVDRQKVTVTGQDGWFLLKKAYERDLLTVMAPRDVIERYTEVWVAPLADNFLSASPGSAWAVDKSPAATVTTSTTTGLNLTAPSGTSAGLDSVALYPASSALSLQAVINLANTNAWTTGNIFQLNIGVNQLSIIGGASPVVQLSSGGPFAQLPWPSGSLGGQHTLLLETDGRWLRGFIDGKLVGYVPFATGSPYGISLKLVAITGASVSATVSPAVFRVLTPFLLRGADKGDYVLPGSASSYPTGGLHGRYYNDLDLQADTNRISKWLNPGRTSYADRLDPGFGTAPQSPKPGAADTNWSVRWFGAIYLKLSQGNYDFSGVTNSGGYRLWVGKTNFGDQIIDEWSSPANQTVTLTASTLASKNPDGTSTAKDGWYPIIIEAYVDSGTWGHTFQFKPPVSYTDPGGTALTGGSSVAIPATSLTPLGCFDNRIQGQSHFDIVQQTAKDFGYQITCEPRQLESGEFPGQLIPRVRVGHDTDEIIEADDLDARCPILNYQSVTDSTDQASSIRGNGAGVPDGSGGQITTEVLDVPSMTAGLFDYQAWEDGTDITFAALLNQRLQTALGLRLNSWQQFTGDPVARDRLADSFPLTGTLSAMRWRPGDGVRLNLPDVNVVDTTTRQITQVTRQCGPEGRTGTQMGFRNRPKSWPYMFRQAYKASVPNRRTYQRQYVTLQGNYVIDLNVPAAASGAASFVPLLPEDRVVKAVARIPTNTGPSAVGLSINGTDRTTNLGGSWSGLPLEIDITPYATQASTTDNRLFANIINKGAVTSSYNLQLIVTVLR